MQPGGQKGAQHPALFGAEVYHLAGLHLIDLAGCHREFACLHMGGGEKAADNGPVRGDQRGRLDALGDQAPADDFRALHLVGADGIGVDGARVDDPIAADAPGPDVSRYAKAAPDHQPVGRQHFILDGLSLGDINGFHIALLLFLIFVVRLSHGR